MVEMSPCLEKININVEVTKDHIKQYATGLDDESIEVFLHQLEPRLSLVLQRETEDYLKFALKHFSESKVNDSEDNSVQS